MNTSNMIDKGSANPGGADCSNSHVISAMQAVTGVAERLVGGRGGPVQRKARGEENIKGVVMFCPLEIC